MQMNGTMLNVTIYGYLEENYVVIDLVAFKCNRKFQLLYYLILKFYITNIWFLCRFSIDC